MGKLFNLARMTTATAGTGTITLGSAVSGYLTFALAGVANGDVVSYGIKDGTNSEVGTGTYTSSGTTLTRTVTKSTNANAAISLSGSAEVFITARAEDIQNVADPLPSAMVATQSDQETATSTALAVTPGRQQFHPSAAKAWVNCGISGNILASYNVTSVTDGGVGQITVNINTDLSSANYVAEVSVVTPSGGFIPGILSLAAGTIQGSCRIAATGFVLTDPAAWCVTVYGDL